MGEERRLTLAIKLKRTDTTLDLSHKAKKSCWKKEEGGEDYKGLAGWAR
jgi:hypothetical protein